MGENVTITEQKSSADKLRERIRHTESDITRTVNTLEERLSPAYLSRQGFRKAQHLAWEGTAKVLELAQRRSVQLSVVGTGALMLLLGNRNVRERMHLPVRRKKVSEGALAANAVKAAGTSALSLWMLMRRRKAHQTSAGEKPAISGLALATTVAKAFRAGAKRSEKSGTTKPGKNQAWRGLASAIGAALGTYYYRQKGMRA